MIPVTYKYDTNTYNWGGTLKIREQRYLVICVFGI